MCREPRLASLLQTNGGLPVDHQEHIKKQLSMRTLRSASSAEPYRACTTGVCRGSGWGRGPLPPEELSNWRGVCLKQCCTTDHYRAVSDAQNRRLTPITFGGDSAMPSMVPLMLLLGSSKLSGVSQEGGREHAHVPNPNRFLRALTKCNPFPHLNSREQELRCGHSIARVGRYRWVLGFPRNG